MPHNDSSSEHHDHRTQAQAQITQHTSQQKLYTALTAKTPAQNAHVDWLYTSPQWVESLVNGYQAGRYGWVWQNLEGLLPPVNTPEMRDALASWEPEGDLSQTHIATLLYIAGLTLTQLGKPEEGQYYIAYGTLKNPTAWDWQVHRAMVCMQAKNLDEALEVIEHVLKHQRHHVLAQETLAQIYNQQGRLDASETRFQKLLQKHPQNTSARYHYALMLHTTKRNLSLARQQYERVLAHAPRMIEARLNLAMLLHEHLQDYSEADTHYQWLLTQESLQESQRLDVLKGLASSAYAQGQTEQAVRYLSEAVRMPSGHQQPELWQQLAQWCWGIGQGEEAQQCEEALLKLAYAHLQLDTMWDTTPTHPECDTMPTTSLTSLPKMSQGLWIYVQYLEQQKQSGRMEQGRDACERLLQDVWEPWATQYEAVLNPAISSEEKETPLSASLQDTLLAWSNIVGIYGLFCEALGDSTQAKQAYLQQQSLLDRLACESPAIWDSQGDKQAILANQGLWSLRTLTPCMAVEPQELIDITEVRQESDRLLYERWQALGQPQATWQSLLAQHMYRYEGTRYGHNVASEDQEALTRHYQQWFKPLPNSDVALSEWHPDNERPLRIGLWITEGREQAFIDYYHGLCTHVLGGNHLPHVCTIIGSRFSKLQMEALYHGETQTPWYVHQEWLHPHTELQDTATRLKQYAFDLLIWDDYGGEPQSTWLPYTDIARCQLTGWSKPVLTGLNTLSLLPPVSQFPWLPPVEHQSPPSILQDQQATRHILGLPEMLDIKLIGCPYHPEKLSPELLQWCCDILEEAESQNLQVRWLWREPAFVSLKQKMVDALEARLSPKTMQNFLWLPPMGQARFMNVLRAMDALIEPPVSGGGRITYEAFRVGTPVFTVEGYTRTPHWHQALGHQSIIPTHCESPETMRQALMAWLHTPTAQQESQYRPYLQQCVQQSLKTYYEALETHRQSWWQHIMQAVVAS